jgi:hypothetical protein
MTISGCMRTKARLRKAETDPNDITQRNFGQIEQPELSEAASYSIIGKYDNVAKFSEITF